MARTRVTPNANIPDIVSQVGQNDNTQVFYRDGELVIEGITQEALDAAVAALLPGGVPITDIEKLKDIAKNKIDETAGEVRSKFITVVPGQSVTYLKKEEDAEKFKTDGYPEADIADYPWVRAEAAAQNDTGRQVTDSILYQRDAWIVIGSKIEEERIRGKVRIEQQLAANGIITARDDAIAALEII